MFKVGDKVICVNAADSGESLEFGKIYTIDTVQEDHVFLEGNGYSWMSSRFALHVEVDYLVEIRQSEYSALIEEINLLQELLAETNQKLAKLYFKPIAEYTLEDWEQARDEKWGFELNDGCYLSVYNVYFDVAEQYPVVTSAGSFTIGGLYYLDNSWPESNIKRRIK